MNKIFISTSSIKKPKIDEIISTIINAGIDNIEFSGGLKYNADLLNELIKLKKQFRFNALLHNYFPPPKMPFVLNLSAPGEVGEKSFEHAKKAIHWSKELNAKKLAFHAGFLIDIPLNEIGKSIKKQRLIDKNEALDTFNKRIKILKEIAGDKVELYVENNVVSKINYDNFDSKNPFLFTDVKSWKELELQGIVKPLIDIAHLKVSCRTLGFDLNEEWNELSALTDYIHISDNDGFSDSNNSIEYNGEIYSLLSNTNLKEKTITLEVYNTIEEIIKSKNLIEKLIN